MDHPSPCHIYGPSPCHIYGSEKKSYIRDMDEDTDSEKRSLFFPLWSDPDVWHWQSPIYVGLFCKRDPECHELNQFSIKRAATLCSHPTNSTQFLCPVSPFSQKKRKTSPICVVVLCKWDSENQKLEEICVPVEQIETQTAACSTQSRKLEESSKRGVIL